MEEPKKILKAVDYYTKYGKDLFNACYIGNIDTVADVKCKIFIELYDEMLSLIKTRHVCSNAPMAAIINEINAKYNKIQRLFYAEYQDTLIQTNQRIVIKPFCEHEFVYILSTQFKQPDLIYQCIMSSPVLAKVISQYKMQKAAIKNPLILDNRIEREYELNQQSIQETTDEISTETEAPHESPIQKQSWIKRVLHNLFH